MRTFADIFRVPAQEQCISWRSIRAAKKARNTAAETRDAGAEKRDANAEKRDANTEGRDANAEGRDANAEKRDANTEGRDASGWRDVRARHASKSSPRGLYPRPQVPSVPWGERFLFKVCLSQRGRPPLLISGRIKNCSLSVSVAGHNPPLT